METTHHLPFKVGQQAESKSFLVGFRGAWFRCKIKSIGLKRRQVTHTLEYFDFPDEKITSIQLYQKSPAHRASRSERRQLMVRPRFPPIYRENEMPDVSTISDIIAIVDDVRKIGDLVDWWKDGCYWSGRVTQILENDKVQIELPEPPMGEGSSYEASRKDLRPSLDWSPEHGWTVPKSKDSEACRYCARLIQPVIQDEGKHEDAATMEASYEFSAASVASHGLGCSLPPPQLSSHPPTSEIQLQQLSGGSVNEEARQTPDMNMDHGIEKTSFSDSVSSTRDNNVSATVGRTTGRDRYNHSASSKKMRTGENEFNSTYSDTIESSILDLEELVNRVKWLRGALDFGFHSANKRKPSWKYLENRSSLTDR